MTDTDPTVLEKWREDIQALAPEERLKMACSMFEFSKDLIAAAIQNESPNISEKDLEKNIFVRFYEKDFSPTTLARVLQHLELTE